MTKDDHVLSEETAFSIGLRHGLRISWNFHITESQLLLELGVNRQKLTIGSKEAQCKLLAESIIGLLSLNEIEAQIDAYCRASSMPNVLQILF